MPEDLLNQKLLNAECAADANENPESIQLRLDRLEGEIAMSGNGMSEAKAGLLLDLGTVYLELQRAGDAWDAAWQAFEFYNNKENWELAVVACDILMAADQKDSLKALAHGIWLGITYPINPETTAAILQHLIDESPQGSDTQAVAAVTAHYIADLRQPEGKAGENLLFFTNQVLARVAAYHRNISSQEEFEIWMAGNEFDNPDSFLPKLSMAVDAMVKGEWWFDRDALRANIPE